MKKRKRIRLNSLIDHEWYDILVAVVVAVVVVVLWPKMWINLSVLIRLYQRVYKVEVNH
jgi:hypothetical protein